jgi:hypothetical protein
VKEIRKNKSEVIRIQLKEYKEHKLIDLRVWYEDENGEYKPTKKGISFNRNLSVNVSNAIINVMSDIDKIEESDDSDNEIQSQ